MQGGPHQGVREPSNPWLSASFICGALAIVIGLVMMTNNEPERGELIAPEQMAGFGIFIAGFVFVVAWMHAGAVTWNARPQVPAVPPSPPSPSRK